MASTGQHTWPVCTLTLVPLLRQQAAGLMPGYLFPLPDTLEEGASGQRNAVWGRNQHSGILMAICRHRPSCCALCELPRYGIVGNPAI